MKININAAFSLNEEVNYKEDGIKQIKYNLVEEKQLTPWAKMLNITL